MVGGGARCSTVHDIIALAQILSTREERIPHHLHFFSLIFFLDLEIWPSEKMLGCPLVLSWSSHHGWYAQKVHRCLNLAKITLPLQFSTLRFAYTSVVHRDIWPDNLLVKRDADGTYSFVLNDLGIARTSNGIDVLPDKPQPRQDSCYWIPEACSSSTDSVQSIG